MLCEAVYVIISPKETKTIQKIKTMYPNIQIINSIFLTFDIEIRASQMQSRLNYRG